MNEKVDLTMWQVYYGVQSENARRFLTLCATKPLETNISLLAQCGLTGTDKTNRRIHHDWGVNYQGFDELCFRLRNEPKIASYFLANLYLPSAIQHMADVLEGRATGGKTEAAKFIINAAGSNRGAAVQKLKETPSGGAGQDPLEELLRDEG